MQNKKNRIKLVLLLSGLLVPFVAGADQAMQAAVLANPCAGCHGTDGKSTGVIPALDKLPVSYIVSAMKEFKQDKRLGSVMNRIAKGYTDKEIDLMASHFENANKAK